MAQAATQPYSARRYALDYAPLKRAVKGRVADDDLTRALYASSASIVEVWPSWVVEPKDAADVLAVVNFAREKGVPITARGAGSGVAGQSLGQGIILDFSVHMNALLEINPQQGFARVQPGIVKDDFDAELKTYDMFFPPDPSSSPWCTVGAMIANNSGGARSIRYGTTKDYLLELDVLTIEGERIKLRPLEVLPEGKLVFPADATPGEKRLAEKCLALLRDNRKTIKKGKPESPRNAAGYNVFDPLHKPDVFGPCGEPPRDYWSDDDIGGGDVGGILDMPKLFCGSEGTLGLLLEARIRILNLPKVQAGAELYFESNDKMAEGILALNATRPTKLEVLDRSFIDVAAKSDPKLAAGIPAKLKSMLIVEYWTNTEEDARKAVDGAIAAVKGKSAFEAKPAYNPADLERAWTIRKVASPILSRVKGDLKPTRWIEDCAVPPWRLPQFIDGFKTICDRHGFSAALFGHGGEGNLHVNPFVNVKNAEHRERMRQAADEILELIQKLKGTISGEHGDGIMRSPYLAQQYGDVYPIMVKLKEMFDPRYLLNPLTKIVNEPREVTDFLRCGEDYARVATGTSIDSPAILEEIEKCHGCGKCRTYCPLMRVGKDEKYSARAKANLLRAVIGGRIDASFLVDQEFKDNMDLCISCEQCLVECPTQVDIPGIAMAFREQYVDRKGPGGIVADVMGKPDKIGKAGSKLAGVTNMLLKNRFLRGIAQQVTGLDERRKLPQMQQAQGVRKLAPLEVPPEVRAKLPHEAVVFPGCFAEYYDPDGEKNTLIEILGALGIAVHAPALNCCGISKITKGDSRGARNDLFENVDKLESYVERGAKVFFSAPSCMLAAKREWPKIVGGSAAQRVADACIDAHEFLLAVFSNESMRKQLKPLEKKVAYHMPCHSKVMGVGAAPMKLMDLIDGGKTVNLDAGCCGLSGTFGLMVDNYELSMKIAMPLYNKINRAKPDVVTSSCGVCQTQIKQGVQNYDGTKVNADSPDVVHPLRLLYEALPKR
ncbi:MAG: FAD-binding protein [Planctomycetes bacterium]|nr:FAD-binding protein [Planctomycetota bacterium]